MALLLRKTRPPAEQDTGSGTGAPPPSQYTSQAFQLWEEQCAPAEKRYVLELSSARPESLEYFGESPCRLEVVGLDGLLPLEVTAGEDDTDQELAAREREALRACLPDLPERSQHGALIWDIPNYLTRAQFAELGAWLGKVLVLDAPVHMVIYTGREMPARPGRFRILSGDQLTREAPDGRHVQCPRLSQGELKRAWPDFEVVRSFLLRNDSQEFVLRSL